MTELLNYFIIFLIASMLPILLFYKFKINIYVCTLICFILTIIFINISFILLFSKNKASEFYEIFWIIPPVFVFIVCKFFVKDLKGGERWGR